MTKHPVLDLEVSKITGIYTEDNALMLNKPEQLKALQDFYGVLDGRKLFDTVHAFDFARKLANRPKVINGR